MCKGVPLWVLVRESRPRLATCWIALDRYEADMQLANVMKSALQLCIIACSTVADAVAVPGQSSGPECRAGRRRQRTERMQGWIPTTPLGSTIRRVRRTAHGALAWNCFHAAGSWHRRTANRTMLEFNQAPASSIVYPRCVGHRLHTGRRGHRRLQVGQMLIFSDSSTCSTAASDSRRTSCHDGT